MSDGSLWAGRGGERAVADRCAAVGLPEPDRRGRLAGRRPQAGAGGAAADARPAARAVVVDALAGLAGLGLGITLALGVSAESAGSLRADGGLATALGRLAGLSAAYAMVVVVVLVARCGPLERAVGQDRLVRWHRRSGRGRCTCCARTAC